MQFENEKMKTINITSKLACIGKYVLFIYNTFSYISTHTSEKF
jgi:hypothetical protein